MTFVNSRLLTEFEAFSVDPAEFGHREHLQVAFEMLHKYGFVNAFARYANGIDTIATNAGAPEKFNVTITLAFLSLVAERIYGTAGTSFEAFMARNESLLARDALTRWYSHEELASEFARSHFLLPNSALRSSTC